MTNELTYIKNAYEQEGLSPEQIAECQSLDIVAVKAGLMQCSAVYRKACGHSEEEDDGMNFTKDDQRRFVQVIRDIANGSDNEELRFKAAIYGRNDFKGRLEPARALAGNNFNVLMINEQLAKVKQVASNITSSVMRPKEIVNV